MPEIELPTTTRQISFAEVVAHNQRAHNQSENGTDQQQKQETNKGKNDDPTVNDPMKELHKYILLLATLVATVTYAAAFSPPGDVWQETSAGHLVGEPIIRDTHRHRYRVFFYSNATAFAASLVVIVIILIHASLEDKLKDKDVSSKYPILKSRWVAVRPLQVAMVLDLLSLMAAYAAGTCRDTFTTIYSSLLVGGVVGYLCGSETVDEVMIGSLLPGNNSGRRKEQHGWWQKLKRWLPEAVSAFRDNDEEIRKRKVLMLLATFAVSVTYAGGLSTPGGFWGGAEDGHRPGDAILKDLHPARLVAFLAFNTMSFVASLLIIVALLNRKLWKTHAYVFIVVALVSLIGAYTAGSCRQTDTTVYVVSLVGAVLVYIVFLLLLVWACEAMTARFKKKSEQEPAVATNDGGDNTNGRADQPEPPEEKPLTDQQIAVEQAPSEEEPLTENQITVEQEPAVAINDGGNNTNGRANQTTPPKSEEEQKPDKQKAVEQARSLVLLLATLAATITYQAGLNPPGGVWQDNMNGNQAGDPILMTTNPRRYRAFYYCNSVSFVASLVATILAQEKRLLKHHVLEAVMILDLFGLIGAYAAGSCRDVSSSIYAMALAGAVLVYVVIHVIFTTLDGSKDQDDDRVEKTRKRLLLFAILVATITYQAGLTPPGGFLLQDDKSGHHAAGDPILLYNFPRRYKTFFYCNTVSYMLSIALILLLVNPNMYRPAIRSHALSVCTAAGLFGLLGAYAAGSTQHLKTSIYTFVLVAVVIFFIGLLFLVFFFVGSSTQATGDNNTTQEQAKDTKKTKEKNDAHERHARHKYIMLLGILVASVTYQAGLVPPGRDWQSGGDGHEAGNPVMHDNRRPRYLAFFYSNSTSFMASIVVILLLLVPKNIFNMFKDTTEHRWHFVMNTTIVLDLLGLLGAYAAGSNRGWKTSVYVLVLVIAVAAYMAIHFFFSWISKPTQKHNGNDNPSQTQARSSCSSCIWQISRS